MAAPVDFDEPTRESPMFDEMETVMQPEVSTPFDPPPAAPVAEWSPPPAPDASWQNQEIGSNTPFQSPPPGAGGQNKTLAIISLVCGILSILCCNWFVFGIAALIMGFIARSKATNDPNNFGGNGLALGGVITGGVSVVLGLIFWVLYVFGFLTGIIGSVM
jgi:hypothetical protein